MTEYYTAPNGRSFPIVSSTPAKLSAAKGKARRKIQLLGSPREAGTLMLSMCPPSVNALFFNKKDGKGRGKTLAYRNWCIFANIELRAQTHWHVPGKVTVTVRVGGSRADADNLLKAALDALVKAGRIEDDRNVIEARAIHDDTVIGTLIEIRVAA